MLMGRNRMWKVLCKLLRKDRATLLSVGNEARFLAVPPARIRPMLADEGVRLASESKLPRVLQARGHRVPSSTACRVMGRPARQIRRSTISPGLAAHVDGRTTGVAGVDGHYGLAEQRDSGARLPVRS